MPRASKTISEPITGGIDAREHRGVGRPGDFEMLLNLNGSQEEGYTTRMGWRRYLADRLCGSGYVNADLHDQMTGMQEIVDIVPQVTTISALPAVPWKYWSVQVYADRFAKEIGSVLVRVSYKSAGGDGQSEVVLPVSGFSVQLLSIPMPGDAHDIHIIRLRGELRSGITETSTTAPTGTGVIVETDQEECLPFLPWENRPITLLRSVSAAAGRRQLLAATSSAIYVNNDSAGNWRVIADGLGRSCEASSDHRFKVETVGDIAIFTNGLDPVLAFNLNDGPAGEHYWSADYIPDLQALRISSANVIGKFGGFIFLADVVADAQTFSSRIYWSDYNNPMSWIPGGESAAGYHEFGLGERVLAILSISGGFRVYTTKAIYNGALVDGSQVFDFTEIYRSDVGDSLPQYPNAIINASDTHFYLGSDSIYSMGLWDRSPQRQEYLHVAAGLIFRGVSSRTAVGYGPLNSYEPIDKSKCQRAVAGYDSINKALWFSWTPIGYNENALSLVIWLRYNKSSLVDHGFSAFEIHRPYFTITLRDWIDSAGICSAKSLVLKKEGSPCDLGSEIVVFDHLYNATESTANPMDPASLIGSLCDVCLPQTCAECESDARFVMASVGDDVSIKEFGFECGVRESITGIRRVVLPDTGEGCYETSQFDWMMQRRLHRFGTESEKLLLGMTFNVSTVSGQQSTLSCQVGVSGCADMTRWSPVERRTVCDSPLWPFEPGIVQTRNPNSVNFPFYQRGEFVTWRLFGSSADSCLSVSGATLKMSVDR